MRINQMQPWFGEEEAQSVYDYIKSGGWCTEFQKTKELEQMICDYTGARYCAMVCNGTIGLMIALMACSVQRGERVITTDYSMPATPYSVSLLGAQPLFVDIDTKTLNIDYRKAWEIIDSGTKIFMPVHIGGRYSGYRKGKVGYNLEDFKPLGMWVIEDAAQCLGSWHNGKHLGTFGNVGVLSFNAFKLASTGQGGCLLTNSKKLYEKIKKLKDFGRAGGRGSSYEILGLNAKFNDALAAIGIEQMKKLSERITKKKAIWLWYHDMLADVEQVKFIDTNLEECTPWYIDILCENRDGLLAYLDEQGIEAQPFYPPMHRLPYYKYLGLKDKNFPNACYVADNGLWLPSSSFLEEDTIEMICGKIRKFYKP